MKTGKATAGLSAQRAAERSHRPATATPPGRLISDRPAPSAIPILRCACGGGCPGCRAGERGPPIQAKLKVGHPGDPWEREADRVADEVVRLQDASTRPSEGGSWSVPEPLRARFEAHVGRDVSRVRLQRGPSASRAAEALNARAFTTGADIAFASGQYAPHTPEGQRLIAHELAHVVQQGGAGPATGAARGSSSPVRGQIQRDIPEAQLPNTPVEQIMVFTL